MSQDTSTQGTGFEDQTSIATGNARECSTSTRTIPCQVCPTFPTAHIPALSAKVVEDFLAKKGWECEVPVRRWFKIQGRWIKGVGRIDGLSPSKIVLEIKTGKPSKGHLLQTGYYQLHIPQSPGAILVYRREANRYENLRPLAKQHLPRVTGCLLSPSAPPLHPSFPHCLPQCVYINLCRREREPTQTNRSG